jgi:hypothetical protein
MAENVIAWYVLGLLSGSALTLSWVAWRTERAARADKPGVHQGSARDTL